MSKRNYPHTPVSATLTAGSDTRDAWPVAFGDELGRALFLFKTMQERDSFATAFPARLFKSWCFVKDNGEGVPAWFDWTGTTEDGSDGTWSPLKIFNLPARGLTFVNADGSTTNDIEVLGLQGLELQGNQKDGFTLVVKGGQATGAFEVVNWNPKSPDNVTDATGIKLGQFLEAYPDPDSGKAVLIIKPGSFARPTAPSMLAYLENPVDVYGKIGTRERIHAGGIWCGDVVYSDPSLIPMYRKDKAIGLQEYDGLDPNVTGGDQFLLGAIVNLNGNAPDDGSVRVEWYDITIGEVARDMEGNMLAVERSYKKGDELTPEHNPLLLLGVVATKGLEKYRLVITDNFADDVLRVQDYTSGPTGIIAQSLSGNSKASAALTQFAEDTGFDIRPEVRYLGAARASMDIYAAEDAQPYESDAGMVATSATGFAIETLSNINTRVENECLIIESADLTLSDMMLKFVFSNIETTMLRGKQVNVPITLMNKDSAWNVGLFAWVGAADAFGRIYNGRNGSDLSLNTGWRLVDSDFISEEVVQGEHDIGFTFTVPKDAVNYAIGLWPSDPRNPLHIELKHMGVDVAVPFWGYSLNAPKIKNLSHLRELGITAVFVQDTQGNAGLRYTLGDSAGGNPLPLGINQHKLPSVFSFDNSLNVVNGSSASGGEGALVCNASGQLTLQFDLSLWSEQKVDTTASFWVVRFDADGNAVAVSTVQTFPVKAGSVNVNRQTAAITIDVMAGDKLGLRGSSNIADGAFLECNNNAQPLVKTFATLKESTR